MTCGDTPKSPHHLSLEHPSCISEMLAQLHLLWACAVPMAFRLIAPALNMLIIRGVVLGA